MARSLSVANRFSIAYLVLAGLLGAAVGTFIVLVEQSGPTPAPPWSSWHPTATARTVQQAQIAAHVGSQYRQSGGVTLVNVVVRDPSKQPSIRDIALTRTLYPTQRSDFISAFRADRTVMYVLCGSGRPQCTIKEGKPSAARTEVLRREALELALYSLRYVDATDSVVVYFPPRDLNYVMYFTKTDLTGQLDKPLRRTLAQVTGPLPQSLSENERGLIDQLTIPRQYRGALNEEGDGANVLYLAPR